MLPLILFGAAYLISRTTKETTEFADGGTLGAGSFAKGGEVRYKMAGRNFGEEIENSRKFRDALVKVYENQSGENTYPENFIKEIALTGKIVKSDGSYYLKDYSYKGTITKFEFLDDKNFLNLLKYTNRPTIKSFKFEEGGTLGAGSFKKGGMAQGYDDREDERLAMKHGKISEKDFVGSHKAKEHSRRDDAMFEERKK